MRDEQLLFFESLAKRELIIPSEASRTEMVPLNRVRQKRPHRLFELEAIYLSKHLAKLKEKFIRKYYPRNKLRRPLISHEKVASEAVKFICDEMLQKAQDHKALMLAADVRDKEIFTQVCQMFVGHGLKKLVKQAQTVVQSREEKSLYGGLSSRRGDTLQYFYDAQANPNDNGRTERKRPAENGQKSKNRFNKFMNKPDKGFASIYQEIQVQMEVDDSKQESEDKEIEQEKENKPDKPLSGGKRAQPSMDSLMDSLYQKSLKPKPTKKMQH